MDKKGLEQTQILIAESEKTSYSRFLGNTYLL
jgi:hypothetical protein